MIRASDRAIAAADALLGGPGDDAALRILVQSLKWASRGACRIKTVHALPLHERKCGAVLRLVELDDIARQIVEVRWRLMQIVAAGIRRCVVGFRASCDAGLAANADAGVIKQADGGIRERGCARLPAMRRCRL